jgi:hypothetical protein
MKLKSLMLLLVALFCTWIMIPTIGHADTGAAVQIGDTLKTVPQAKQGALWAPGSQEVVYIATWQLIGVQRFAIEGGYLTAGGLVGVLSYDVGGLKDLGVKVPILDLVEFNVGYGLGTQFIGTQNKGISGWTATLLKAKF